MGVAYTDDGQPYGGRGGAVYNGGESSTILFSRLAIFKDNVGALVSCTLSPLISRGRERIKGGCMHARVGEMSRD